MIDSSSGEPAHRQVARELERRILAEKQGYGPGWVLPPAARLARELGLGERTVLAAYRLLAEAGLVTVRPGYGAIVRTEREREVVEVTPGAEITSRMPTLAERDRWGLVPVLVVDGVAYPADRVRLRVAGNPGGDG